MRQNSFLGFIVILLAAKHIEPCRAWQDSRKAGRMLVEIRLHPLFSSPVPPTPSRWWMRMLIGKPDEDLLQSLLKEGESGTKRDADYWYTLGMLQVVLNKPEEAQRSLTQALDGDEFAALDARPWALLGRIFEAYGLADAAATAYERARSSPQPDEMAKWTISLIGR